MELLALDIGGANLKVADGKGFAASRRFALWKQPDGLADALRAMLAGAPKAGHLAATMTGELADCYRTKEEGVRRIVVALVEAAEGRDVRVFRVDGRFVAPEEAIQEPMLAAAANWRALAQFAARYINGGAAITIDVGSTTTDVVPLAGGRVVAMGTNDPERLLAGELVYTGVERSPVCAIAAALPWRGAKCPTAQEFFATALDAYLATGDLPEDTDERDTADGRPATKEFARERLARSICSDRTMFDEADALAAARAIETAQLSRLGIAAGQVVRRLPEPPRTVVISGRGEFLARRLVERLRLDAKIVSLANELGPMVSRCATAHALAVLAREKHQQDASNTRS